ncbi:LysR family transcriptional regulator (plasmid) [Phyllobacterium sp. A18/5-2]|uniref:LysR family transcriptional regulator n=1 Tax=Phyllobacterium sp. A18/5-2 TaxID=2978392 RepID=UPI0021C913E2|nr:LysR family transcriptional regulator [Phyllobacterium sp. A18/5-2]UXN66124.1 LysR family transcriptional regulator [Phyllobacterium sp. A18/5-2]
MDIDRARTFLEIIHSGSFLKASERLHVTQTTVSARIRNLEEEIGRQLFIRNRNGTQLTPAGKEFERYAQSLVQIWERARQQLAVPHGKTSVVAAGCELSLWNPLFLDWLVQMRTAYPMTAIQAHVGLADQLLEQLRTGALDIAILYAPRLLPGIKVELLIEEKLVLVKATPQDPEVEPEYVHVDWGPVFAAQHGAISAPFGSPGLFVGLGPLGLNYIVRTGGMGYFRKGSVAPFLKTGELEIINSAPEFVYPAYAVYMDESENRQDIKEALTALRHVAE